MLSDVSYCPVASAPDFPNPKLTLKLCTPTWVSLLGFLRDGWVPPGWAPWEQPMRVLRGVRWAVPLLELGTSASLALEGGWGCNRVFWY